MGDRSVSSTVIRCCDRSFPFDSRAAAGRPAPIVGTLTAVELFCTGADPPKVIYIASDSIGSAKHLVAGKPQSNICARRVLCPAVI